MANHLQGNKLMPCSLSSLLAAPISHSSISHSFLGIFMISKILSPFCLIGGCFSLTHCKPAALKQGGQEISVPFAVDKFSCQGAQCDELKVLEHRVKDTNYRGRNDFPHSVASSYTTPIGGALATTTELMAIGNAAFEYALYGCWRSSQAHLQVANEIIREVVLTKKLKVYDKNAPLVASWFVSKIVRGALHLQECSPSIARDTVAETVKWIETHQLENITHACTKDFVKNGCQDGGSTNRTFALLEAQLLYLDLAGKQSAIQEILKDEGEYVRYLKKYFHNLGDCRAGNCATKDFDRNDGKHPAMGFQSIMKIEKMRRTKLPNSNFDYEEKLKIATEEAAKLDVAYSNQGDRTSCYTGGPWESAPLILGVLSQAIQSAQTIVRSKAKDCKKPYHAWGYDLLSKVF
jgi:hypothetical protein